MQIVLKGDKGEVTIEAKPHTFKSLTQGYYFRDRVVIDEVEYHVQIIISKKG